MAVGNSSCVFQPGASLEESEMWIRAKEIYPACREYAWPDRSAKAEKISFKLQSDKHVSPQDRYQPTRKELDEADDILGQYVQHDVPYCFFDGSEEEVRRYIREMMSFVKRDSTPGVPYALMCSSNGELFDKYGSIVEQAVYDRYVKLMSIEYETLRSMNPMQMVTMELQDPVRIFVKSEPHKIKKLLEGKVRLIHCVSIVDKLLEMVMVRHLTKKEIANWYRIPSKPGIGFTESDCALVYQDVIDALPMSASDVVAWDWNVDEWQILDDAEMIIKLQTVRNPSWEHLVRCTAFMECRRVFQFSDGELVVNNYPGVVNSGKFKTSSGNSRMRVKLARMVGSTKTVAAGDDAVEQTVENAVEKYAKYGFEIKAYDEVVDQFEFCSRLYMNGKSWPLNDAKMIMNLLHTKPSNMFEFQMYMIGFTDSLQFHPDFERIMSVVHEVGYFELGGAQEVVE